ncbi:translation initiation factor eIF-1A [Thermococcus indicus]|uniref:Translation initiation factor 1A n=1 Tax=Thermococcus indicus TaxID=2586643 RepID=A0A4Y5SQ43_9EURY|nr:translation initiation factor eIF-1A [Thermococcus indicus]QDA32474.1 translation initiation factor eIF-1A [Thermococcus indicus]
MAYHRGRGGRSGGKKKNRQVQGDEVIRVPLPKEGQLFGVIEQALGSGWMDVRCSDGKIRRCRIPGKLKRRMWMRVGDVVIVQPWEVQTEERGDIVYRYTRTQVDWLLRRGKISQEFLSGGELLF